METLSTLVALPGGNSLANRQLSAMQSFEDFFVLGQNKILNKLSSCGQFETPKRSCDVIVMWPLIPIRRPLHCNILPEIRSDYIKKYW